MKSRIISVILVFLLSISITACSSNKSSSTLNKSNIPNTPSDSKSEITKTQIPSENKIHTVTAEKILNILLTKNKDVIDSLNLSNSDVIKSLNGQNFYVPVFQSGEVGVLIGFNGAQFDSIDKVKRNNETPIFIIPSSGTIISFDNNFNFRNGDDMKEFKTKFGEGNASKEVNLKGDKQYSILTYDISNLCIRFTSLDGDDFKKYDIYISKLQNSPTSSPIVSTNGQYSVMEAYKAVLQNKVKFFSTGDCFSDDKKNIYLDNLLKDAEMPESPTLKVTHFTVLDMDEDKTPEVVLELSVAGKEYPDFYEVLHFINGTVYGYNFGVRGLGNLKKDATFMYSCGAGDWGISKLTFTSNAYEYHKIAYCESSDNKGGITELYFINNKPGTAESFDSSIKEQDEKKDTVCYEFSQKNIETELTNK